MANTKSVEINEYSQDEINNKWFDWSCGLWFDDFEEAGIDRCYIATVDDVVVGFQTVSGDGLCVAIEVHPDYQEQGIASALVEESNCWKPERNECPEFWASMREKYGY
jgi:GNAT superfamily N-acetyltransferase